MNIKKGYAIYDTIFGKMKLGYDGEVLTYLKVTEEVGGCKTSFTDRVYSELLEYFEGRRRKFGFDYILEGTEFQKRVWKALETIPYGTLATYKDIAKLIGNEKASRAVGLANNKNPLTIVVPCHRVVGSDGRLVGYFGGIEMKKRLLEIEGVRRSWN